MIRTDIDDILYLLEIQANGARVHLARTIASVIGSDYMSDTYDHLPHVERVRTKREQDNLIEFIRKMGHVLNWVVLREYYYSRAWKRLVDPKEPPCAEKAETYR